MRRYDLICIGCGPAGEKAATQAAYFKKKVAVIERHPRPGGAMINTGTIPSKALRETALVYSIVRRRPVPGIERQLDRSLSIVQLQAHRHLIQMQEHDRVEASFDRHGIDVILGVGRMVDANHVEVEYGDGETEVIAADKILISTGSRPYQPDHIPFDHPRVVDADGVLELPKRPDSMIIVGGGVIGCEYACIFGEIGVRVTLIEPRDAILPFLDAECRELLVRTMQDQNITIRYGAKVDRVDPGQCDVRAWFDTGDHLDADILMWAAGRNGNSGGIGLENLGIEPDSRGNIPVDENYQTAVPGVYAAGDVIGFPALASTSMEQGRVAACHMFNLGFKTGLARDLPLGLYTIPTIASVGLTEDEARTQGYDVVVGRASYAQNARGRMLGDAHGLTKCVFERSSRRLLGAQIIGEQATEMIHLAQFLIARDGVIDDFVNACFNYPSLTETYKYAAYSALQAIAADEKRDDELGRGAMVA